MASDLAAAAVTASCIGETGLIDGRIGIGTALFHVALLANGARSLIEPVPSTPLALTGEGLDVGAWDEGSVRGVKSVVLTDFLNHDDFLWEILPWLDSGEFSRPINVELLLRRSFAVFDLGLTGSTASAKYSC